MGGFTTQQTRTLVVLVASNLLVLFVNGLMAPFFPELATDKGASPTLYTIVFGVFRLSMGLSNVLYGQSFFVSRINPVYVLPGSVMITSFCSLLMCIVEYIEETNTFIIASSAIQLAAGMGTAMMTFITFILINMEFPKSSSTIFAVIETTHGTAYFLAPAFGGWLIDIGGFKLPFIVLGCILFLLTLVAFFMLPKSPKSPGSITDFPTSSSSATSGRTTLSQLLHKLAFIVYLYLESAACFAYGWYLGTLEYHLRSHATVWETNIIFILNGVIYCLASLVIGKVCDKLQVYPATVTSWGALTMLIGVLLLGPAPFIPALFKIIWFSAIGSVLFSIGNGALIIGTLAGTRDEALATGAPDNVETNGKVSGIWNMCYSMFFALGFFVSGAMLDGIGYEWSSLIVASAVGIAFIVSVYIYFQKKYEGNISIGQSKVANPTISSVCLVHEPQTTQYA